MKAMQAAIVLLLDVPLGYMADRWGRRNLICMANIATALWLGLTALGGAGAFEVESGSALASGISVNVVLFFVAEAFNAFALAAFSGAFSAVLLETYERQHDRRDFENILGLYGKWQFALMAVAAFIGAWAGGSASAVVWWISAGATLVLALTTRFFLLLCYQILLQFWQPLISSFATDDRSGWLYGLAFVFFLVAQSVASEHARKQRSVKIYLILSFLLTSLFGALYCIGVDVSLVLMLIVLVSVFYLLKLLAIAFFAELQRLLPRHLWATTESSLSTAMRLLFIALLPLIGASGDRNDLAAIVLIVGCVLAFATTLLLVAFLTTGQKRKDLTV